MTQNKVIWSKKHRDVNVLYILIAFMIAALLIKPKAFADWWLYIEYEIKMTRPETDWCIKYYQNQRLVVVLGSNIISAITISSFYYIGL